MNILSSVFVFFMLILILLLSLIRQERARQTILLVASYLFYAYADYRFLGILLTQTMIACCTARIIDKGRKKGTQKSVPSCVRWHVLILAGSCFGQILLRRPGL